MNLPDPAHIISSLQAQSKKEALEELIALFQDIDQTALVHALLERETLGSTAIISGMALPHAKIATIDQIMISVGRSKTGIQWGAKDGQPIHLIFLLLAPESTGKTYLQALSSLSRIIKNNSNCALLQNAQDEDEINLILKGCLNSL